MIRSRFEVNTPEAIFQTSTRQEDDKLVWIQERNESYSVKSGYSMAFNFFHTPIDTLPVQCSNRKLWKALWEMWVPPKVKILVSKLMHEGLLVRQNVDQDLQRWMINVLGVILKENHFNTASYLAPILCKSGH